MSVLTVATIQSGPLDLYVSYVVGWSLLVLGAVLALGEAFTASSLGH